MDMKKQIEEMQKIMEHCCNVYDDKGNHVRNKCNAYDCEYYCDTNHVCCSFSKKEAIALYEAGYRKIPEGSVVLTVEKIANYEQELREKWEKDIDEARKETAREIFALLQEYYHQASDTIILDIDDFYKLAKGYGVEVE